MEGNKLKNCFWRKVLRVGDEIRNDGHRLLRRWSCLRLENKQDGGMLGCGRVALPPSCVRRNPLGEQMDYYQSCGVSRRKGSVNGVHACACACACVCVGGQVSSAAGLCTDKQSKTV